MPRIFLPGYSSRWPWRYSILVLAAFVIGRVSHFVVPSVPMFAQHAKPPSPELTPACLPPATENIVIPDDLDPLSVKAMAMAQSNVDAIRQRQSTTLDEAVARYTLKAGRPPPPNFDRWFQFARENQCLIDDYDQIHRDFAPFYQLAVDNPTYFQSMIEKGHAMILQETAGLPRKKQEAVGLTAIRIEAGKLRMPTYSGTAFAKDMPFSLRKAPYGVPLEWTDEPRVLFNYRELDARTRASTDFFRNQSGCSPLGKSPGFAYDESPNIAFLRSSSSSDFTTDLWPLLSMTKLSPCFSDILFPAESKWSGKLPATATNLTWSEKKPQLYWRGASNGGHIIHENYRSFPRFRLIDLARTHSDLLTIVKEYNITQMVRRTDALRYKYLLDVDGNTFSGRFLDLLKSGSLVFKSTVFEEYFNDWIRPYEHFIPVRPDLSDLIDKARRIQETGKLFTERVMTDAQNDCYFAMAAHDASAGL
ncbi:hypothetical protein K438DRAFT_1812950 [Mycena galopus ATCC 62051]|nr:hypothetical protein K438DRAFT_1812950 [Mycena galopus ATCC 62051]